MTDPIWNGPLGRACAAGLALIIVALIWLAVLAPAWNWFTDQGIELRQQQTLLKQMRRQSASIPQLREQASHLADLAGEDHSAILPGATDTLAAADLQERARVIADTIGAKVEVVDTIPATATGEWRKISIRIGLSAQWPALMTLLRSIEDAHILVDDLHMTSDGMVTRSQVPPIQASMTLYGFRSSGSEPGT